MLHYVGTWEQESPVFPGMGGRITAPKHVHILTPGPYECVRVCGNGALRLQIELSFVDELTLK